MNISLSTGVKEVNFTDEHGNVKSTVYFNPTDPVFAERLYKTFSTLDANDEQYHKRIVEEKDATKIFDIARTMDAEMRKMIDELLSSTGVCDAIFGKISIYAWCDGMPLWANLLLAIMSEMDNALDAEKKASDPRIQKYTSKFSKKAG